MGDTVRIDLELLPSMIQIQPGHQLRLVVASQPADDFRQYSPTSELPNPVTPTPTEFSNLVGGIYTIYFGSATPSALNLSTASEKDLLFSATNWGPGT
jgi:predicted acyl esterase